LAGAIFTAFTRLGRSGRWQLNLVGVLCGAGRNWNFGLLLDAQDVSNGKAKKNEKLPKEGVDKP
jgi:hypothetical protein